MTEIVLGILRDSSSEIIAAIVPTLVAAFLASAWWKSRAAWLRALVEALAKGAVIQVEKTYVEPRKAAARVDKLTTTQQELAKELATHTIKNALIDVGVTAVSAAGPVISAAIEKAVADMKKTVPPETQKLFS